MSAELIRTDAGADEMSRHQARFLSSRAAAPRCASAATALEQVMQGRT